MSFLTPFYILGIAAIAAPIIFHLIRRAPKGEVPFSSLMFLTPTPPRLTRRSRLDNWLLLLLRAAALCLLAFAFARPFLREAANLDFGDEPQRRIAVLIDTSASMRRGDLWPRAQALARQAINDCRPTDQLAVFAFDATFRPLLGFHESASLDPAGRRSIATGHVDRLKPTWNGTNLGQALIDTVGAIEDVADTSEKAGRMPRRVILIGDMPQGSRLDALGDFEWPSDVELDVKAVTDTGANAGLERLVAQNDIEPGGADTSRRVRVLNNPDSRREKFALTWIDDKGAAADKPIDVYVPPGESRVARVPRPPAGVRHPLLRLSGDAQAFDNTLYFADERRDEMIVYYIGPDDRDDPRGLVYYLERVFGDSRDRSVQIVSAVPSKRLAWDAKTPPRLVIVAAESAVNLGGLSAYLRAGGTVLDVVTAAGRSETLAGLCGVAPFDIEEATVGRDVMLGEIAFDHRLFAPLAGAQFNDFTKIHFWKYRRIKGDRLGESRVLARFETSDPALIEKSVDKGRLLILTSGWQPADSQLARSSKFVPFMAALLESHIAQPVSVANLRIGERILLPVIDDAARGLVVRKPDGAAVTVPPHATFFDGTDQPGIYTIDAPSGPLAFAVNLDPQESKTAPLPVETIEQFGVRLASHSPKTVDPERRRQMYNAELEGRQQLWRWLILAVIGTLILETWIAGRTTERRPHAVQAEVLTT